MAGTISRPPMYQSELGKKNIWTGEGFLETNGRRYPIRITEVDHGNCDGTLNFKGYFDHTLFNRFDYSDIAHRSPSKKLEITQVIYHKPATIVFWNDGTKTVVKCSEEDTYSPEVGLVTAIAKKFFGNVGNYNNELRKWSPATCFEPDGVPETQKTTADTLAESLAYLSEIAKNPFKGLL